MSAFLSDLDTRCIDDTAQEGRGIHKLLAPFRFQSDLLARLELVKDGIIEVPAGFFTDFESCPRKPFVYWLFGGIARKPATIHDYLFHHHEICDEQTANAVLLEAMEVDGITPWQRLGIWLGVVVGGKSSWEEDAAGDGTTVVEGRIV